MERAKRLLAETDWTITEMAFELGFSTSAYFTALFHRVTGVTPTQFRRRSRAAAGKSGEDENDAGDDDN